MARAFRTRRVTVGGRRELRYAARLDPAERALVSGLLTQVADLIGPPEGAGSAAAQSHDEFDAIVAGLGMELSADPVDAAGQVGSRGERPGHVSDDEDPAVRRLFPIANRTDPEAAAEFARLSEASLRQRKWDNLQRAVTLLGVRDDLELTAADAQSLLVALTDVRIVLGERMGLRTDDDAAALDAEAGALDEDDPRLPFILVYDFLTWLQETLASALLKGLT